MHSIIHKGIDNKVVLLDGFGVDTDSGGGDGGVIVVVVRQVVAVVALL
jgi:hypothetical protein